MHVTIHSVKTKKTISLLSPEGSSPFEMISQVSAMNKITKVLLILVASHAFWVKKSLFRPFPSCCPCQPANTARMQLLALKLIMLNWCNPCCMATQISWFQYIWSVSGAPKPIWVLMLRDCTTLTMCTQKMMLLNYCHFFGLRRALASSGEWAFPATTTSVAGCDSHSALHT